MSLFEIDRTMPLALRAAKRRGVHLAPGPVFSVEGGADDWLRLPFAKPELQLIDAAQRIAQVWHTLPHDPALRRGAVHRLIA